MIFPRKGRTRWVVVIACAAAAALAQGPFPDLPDRIQPCGNPHLPAVCEAFEPPVSSNDPPLNAPQVAEWTRSAEPGDTIALTGCDFSRYSGADFGKDTRFLVFSQAGSSTGAIQQADILRLSDDEAAIRLPANLPGEGGLLLIWPANEAGVGRPFVVNRPDAWWTGPDAAAPGEAVSVYGQDLSRHPSTFPGQHRALLYLLPDSGSGQWVEADGGNPYKMDFRLPTNLIAGSYEVWLHNTRGGRYGWSRGPSNLVVRPAMAWTGAVFDVTAYGAIPDDGSSDVGAIQAAIAASTDGSTLFFPAGTYNGDARYTIPARRRVLGAGMTQTVVRAAIRVSGPAEVRDITFESPWLGNVGDYFSTASGDDIRFESVALLAEKEFVLSVNGQRNFLTSCTLAGQHVWLGDSRQFFVDGCVFRARYDTENMLTSWGGCQQSIVNSICRHDDDSDPANWRGWGEGRFYTGSPYWGTQSGLYFGSNTTVNFTVRPGADQNSGEQLMWEGSTVNYQGGITSATPTTVTFDPLGTDPTAGPKRLVVVAGRGKGQWRTPVAYDPVTHTTTLDRPWRVLPDAASSRIVLVRTVENVAIVGNTLQGTDRAVTNAAHIASTGIMTFQGGLQVVADGNTLRDLRVGVSLHMYADAGENSPTYFCRYANNTLDHARWGFTCTAQPSNGVATLGLCLRGNQFSNIVAEAFTIGTASTGSDASPELTLLDGNRVVNGPRGFLGPPSGVSRNTILTGNAFTRGSVSKPGTTGLVFRAALQPLLLGNSCDGFASALGGALPGPVPELPQRVVDLAAPTNGTAECGFALWNGGVGDLVWQAGAGASWLTLSPTSGTVASQAEAGSLTLTARAQGLAAGAYTAEVAVVSASRTNKATVCFTVGDPPSIAGCSVSGVVVEAGARLTITGAGFTAGTVVLVGGVPASNVTVNSANSLTVTLPDPPAGAGLYSVTVINPDGQTAQLAGAVGYGRFLDRLEPADAQRAGGQHVAVYGGGFETGMVFCVAGRTAAVVQIVSPRQAVIAVPASPVVGRVAVTAIFGGTAFAGDPRFGYAAPYLNRYFGATGVAALQAKSRQPLFAPYGRAIREMADRYVDDPPTNRLDATCNILNFLLYAYLLDGKQAYRDRLLREAAFVATPLPWTNQAEMRGVWMAIVYNALAAELSEDERLLFERFLEDFLDAGDFGWLANTGSNTVGTGCAGAGLVGMALLHLGYPGAQAAIDMAEDRAETGYLDLAIRPDGGCPEGSLYWDYGLTYFLIFAHAYADFTGDSRYLERSCFSNNVHFVEAVMGGDPAAPMFPFNDSSVHLTGVAAGADFGGRFNQPLMRWLADELVADGVRRNDITSHGSPRFATLGLLWRDEAAAPPACPPLPTLVALSNDTHLVAMRSDPGRYPALAMQAKGGSPPFTHHRNYDAGSFVVQANGETYLLDPGYGVGCDSDGKQTVHSLPLIDGQGVLNGSSGSFVAPVVSAWELAGLGLRGATLDTTAAYMGGAVMRCRRTFVLADRAGAADALVVLDDIVAAGVGQITAQWQTAFPCEAPSGGREAFVQGNRGQIYLRTFGPAQSLAVGEQAELGWPWQAARDAGVSNTWMRLTGAYTANPGQPLVTLMAPLSASGSTPLTGAQYGEGFVDVTLPSGLVLRFAHEAGGWAFQQVVGPATPVVSLIATTDKADESGPVAGRFALSRAAADCSAPLTVHVALMGSAGASDYSETFTGTATIPAGVSGVQLTVTPIADGVAEPDETVVLTLQPDPAYALHAVATNATVLIMDADAPPTVTLAVPDANATEIGGNPGTFEVRRGKLRPGPLTVAYTLSGTAQECLDYDELNGTVTIPEGDYSAMVTIHPIADGILEPAETVVLALTGGAGFVLGSVSTGTVTITDGITQDTLTWTGNGGDGRWSTPANWLPGATHLTPDWGDRVVIPSAAGDRLILQDIPGLNLYGLSVAQTNAGALTLRLSEDLTVNDGDVATLPIIAVQTGSFTLDAGARSFAWDARGNNLLDVPTGMTIRVAGGRIGNINGHSELRIRAGGRLAGTGSLCGTKGHGSWSSYCGLLVETGAVVEVGDGILDMPDGAGQAKLYGAINGTTLRSRLYMGTGGPWGLAVGPSARVTGLSEWRIYASGSAWTGRWSQAARDDFAATTIHAYKPNTLFVEAQTTTNDLAAFKIGELRLSGGFSSFMAWIKLADTGTNAADFVYASTLSGLSTLGRIDLNGRALLTDMRPEPLQAFLSAGTVTNSATNGAATVKALAIGGGQTRYYLAPGSVSLGPAGNWPPSVALAQPTNRSVFKAGSPIGIAASATDPDGAVTSVTFWCGSQWLGAAAASPFAMIWTNAPPGDWTLKAVAVDNASCTTESAVVSIHVNAESNQRPEANAGPDQAVDDTDDNGVETVSFDGSGSSDPDGRLVAYIWSEGGVQIARGATTQAVLSVGIHTIRLVVSDEDGATATDTVQVVVRDIHNLPPVSEAGPDQAVTDSDNDGRATVTLNGAASHDPDGAIVAYTWREGAGLLATGAAPQVILAVGTHALSLAVTDNGGLSATDTVTVIVRPYSGGGGGNGSAAQYYWDADGAGSGAVGGAGTWNTNSACWRTNLVAGAPTVWPDGSPNNDIASFPSATGTVTVAAGATIHAGTLDLRLSGYVFAGGDGSSRLVFAGTNSQVTSLSPVQATVGALFTNLVIDAGCGVSFSQNGGSSPFTLAADTRLTGAGAVTLGFPPLGGTYGATLSVNATNNAGFGGGFAVTGGARREALLRAEAVGSLGAGPALATGYSRIIYRWGAQALAGGTAAGVTATAGGVIDLVGAYGSTPDRFIVNAGGVLRGSTTDLARITGVSAFTANPLRPEAILAAGAVVACSNRTTAPVLSGQTPEAGLYLGLGADFDSTNWAITIGAGTPWKGFANDTQTASPGGTTLITRRWQAGTATVVSGDRFGEIEFLTQGRGYAAYAPGSFFGSSFAYNPLIVGNNTLAPVLKLASGSVPVPARVMSGSEVDIDAAGFNPAAISRYVVSEKAVLISTRSSAFNGRDIELQGGVCGVDPNHIGSPAGVQDYAGTVTVARLSRVYMARKTAGTAETLTISNLVRSGSAVLEIYNSVAGSLAGDEQVRVIATNGLLRGAILDPWVLATGNGGNGDFLGYGVAGMTSAPYATAFGNGNVVTGVAAIAGTVNADSFIYSANVSGSGTLSLGILQDGSRAARAGLISQSGNGASLAPAVDAGSAELVFYGNNGGTTRVDTLNGRVTANGLTKAGDHILVLNHASNNLGGAVTVWRGTLRIGGGNGLNPEAQVTVGSDGVFDVAAPAGGQETLAALGGRGTVNLAAGKTNLVADTLAAGDATAPLTVTGAGVLSLGPGATVAFELDGVETPAVVPRLQMPDATLALGSGVSVRVASFTRAPAGTFSLTYALIDCPHRTGAILPAVQAPAGLTAQLVYDEAAGLVSVRLARGPTRSGVVIMVR